MGLTLSTHFQKSRSSTSTRSATIELSSKVLDTHAKLRNTLLHECCHVAAWIIDATSKPPHGSVFKKWAAVAKKSYPDDKDLVVTTCHSYEIQFKFWYECIDMVGCGKRFGRHSRSIDLDTQGCGSCRGRLRLLEPVTRMKKDGTPMKESAYALFIKV